MSIWAGIGIFLSLVFLVAVCVVIIIFCIIEINNNSGWRVFWLTIALIEIAILLGFVVWTGGTQIIQ